ncbi:MAG: SpoIIE family protein phosphatase [Terriglobia bacterium]
MGNELSEPPPLIEWGMAAQPLEGEAESGDQYVVRPLPNGVLVAAVDGLGHGPEAAAAARSAVVTLADYAHEPVISLIKRCHERLIRTRGVVMSLASFNALDNTMTWLGVGNVEGALLRADATARPARESILLRGGVVGYQLPALHASILPVTRGDVLILATDGIRGGFVEDVTLSDPPQQIAEQILARRASGADDALVLVARYLGHEP